MQSVDHLPDVGPDGVVVQGGDQVLDLAVEPGQCLGRGVELPVGGMLGAGHPGVGGEGHRLGGQGPSQVPAGESAARGLAVGPGVLGLGAPPGVQPGEVVEDEAVRRRFADQVGVQQAVHESGGLAPGEAGQDRGRRDREVRAREQAEAAEQPSGVGVQGVVGLSEDGLHGAVAVAGGLERGQAVALEQGADVVGDRRQRVVGDVGGRDAQRQRQASARLGQSAGRARLGPQALGAEDAFEQLLGLLGRHRFDRHLARAFAHDQAGQPDPAGDQGGRARTGGQQRADLVDRPGVVEQHQQALVGDRRAVQADEFVGLHRDGVLGQPQGAERPGDGLRRGHRGPRVVAAQVDVQLAVGEEVGHSAAPVHGQRRLAHSGGADHRDRARDPPVGQAPGQEVVELVEQAAPAHERWRRGQLHRHRWYRRRLRGLGGHAVHRRRGRGGRFVPGGRGRRPGRPGGRHGVQGGVGAQDRLLGVGEPAARGESLLLGQQRAQFARLLQRRGLTARVVQGEHQLPPQRLVQGVRRDQRHQVVDERAVVPGGELQVRQVLVGGQAQTGELGLRGLGVADRDVGQRHALPQCERLADPAHRRAAVAARGLLAGPGHAVAEDVQVEFAVVDGDRVAGGPALDRDLGPGVAAGPAQ